MLQKRFDVIAFDLDGTLIDSKPSIVYGLQQAMKEFDLKPASKADLRQLIGLPLPEIFASLGFPKIDYEELRRRYSRWMFEHMESHLKAFDGVVDVLKQLKHDGYSLAIVTSRGRDSLVPCLELANISHRMFDCLIAREDTREHKPSPIPLRLAQMLLGCPQERLLYVGDATVDVMSAKAAGSPVVYAGYDSDHDLVAEDRNYILGVADRFADVRNYIDGVSHLRAKAG